MNDAAANASESASPLSGGLILILSLLVAIVGAQYVLWFGDQGLVRWRHTDRQLQHMEERILVIEERIHRLKREIRLADADPLILEEVARRQLGYAYKDEIIFVDPTQTGVAHVSQSPNDAATQTRP
ncbi:FtsB family cell division protein [Magnetofaba australis]|uniref:Putative cell division protein FtsB n=1 Tax=Magnetofaba australis IT-1 TaxID=1434232 RepID=A0A1Y2K0P0_9PROT|nr:septum formation initiator family protein [Magnetofaba australis]OSM00364.1 putative cell division protein FtsB [Magnetofaba australis IT-1]